MVEVKITVRRRRPRKSNIICYIDTEFNAFDYFGQNGGLQEIIQIGAVIVKNGRIIDDYNAYCALKKGHSLSKRTIRLTGITPETLKDAPGFETVAEDFLDFINLYKPAYFYAYGNEDRLQLLNTARANGIANKEMISVFERIEDNMKRLNVMLGRSSRGNQTLSVKDLCEICGLEAEGIHDASVDAKYLAMCSEAIKRGSYDAAKLNAIQDSKRWMSDYRAMRRFRTPSEELQLSDEALTPIAEMIAKLSEKGLYPDYQLKALYDDLLMVSGRIPDVDMNEKRN